MLDLSSEFDSLFVDKGLYYSITPTATETFGVKVLHKERKF